SSDISLVVYQPLHLVLSLPFQKHTSHKIQLFESLVSMTNMMATIGKLEIVVKKITLLLFVERSLYNIALLARMA
ncbi:hypothetical protein N9L14_03720, partial [Alphaproteobacteria bacterium]|nr:hypothetical protein [Alphaproteobacteria bacterium]